MKQVLENTVYVNAEGEVIDRVAKFVNYGRRTGYNKIMRYDYSDVPHWFWCRVMEEAKLDKQTGCLAVELTALYNSFKNPKTFRKYIAAMESENFICKLGTHYYLINPAYVHHGNQSSTEHAIIEYNIFTESVANGGETAKLMKRQAANERRIKRVKNAANAPDLELSKGEKRSLIEVPTL